MFYRDGFVTGSPLPPGRSGRRATVAADGRMGVTQCGYVGAFGETAGRAGRAVPARGLGVNLRLDCSGPRSAADSRRAAIRPQKDNAGEFLAGHVRAGASVPRFHDTEHPVRDVKGDAVKLPVPLGDGAAAFPPVDVAAHAVGVGKL